MQNLVLVENPQVAFAKVLKIFHLPLKPQPGKFQRLITGSLHLLRRYQQFVTQRFTERENEDNL
jgi:hypothetical protein